jgi:hypothetical protein
MTDDRELAKKCAFDARALLNDMQGNGHIDELKLLKAMQLLVNAVQALAAREGTDGRDLRDLQPVNDRLPLPGRHVPRQSHLGGDPL